MMVICITVDYGKLQRICSTVQSAVDYMLNQIEQKAQEDESLDTKLIFHPDQIKSYLEVRYPQATETYTVSGVFVDEDYMVNVDDPVFSALKKECRRLGWSYEKVPGRGESS